jgi:hypothetical protein
MSVNLSKEWQLSQYNCSTPSRTTDSGESASKYARRSPNRRRSDSRATDNEETNFVAKAAFAMAVFAMTPLILFHIVTYFYPDIFMIPIVPN